MTLLNKAVLANIVAVFLVKQDTEGVAKAPTAATDTIRLAKNPEFPKQAHPEIEQFFEATGTRSATANIRKAQEPGSVALKFAFCPSGAAGTPPAEAPILKAAGMEETVNAGVSVSYAPKATKDVYTLWFKDKAGGFVSFCVDCTINSLKGARAKGAAFLGEAAAEFARRGWVGESQLNGAILAGATTAVVDDEKQFCVGGLIKIGTEAVPNQITAITTATKTLTFTPGVVGGQGDDAAVVGYLPEPVLVGAPIETPPEVKIGGVAIAYKEASFEITEPSVFDTEETPANPDTEDYPSAPVFPAGRVVKGTAKIKMRTQDAAQLKRDTADKTFAIDASRATIAAGSRMAYAMPQAGFRVAEETSSETSTDFTLEFFGKCSAGNSEDECSFLYE